MYTRILVPLDGSKLSEQALPCARLLAKALQAPVELLRVLERMNPGPVESSALQYMEQAADRARAQASQYLDQMAASLRAEGIKASRTFLEGDPATHIVAEAGKDPRTLIAMSTHGYSGFGRWLLGSITDKVLHTATSPLLIVRPRDQEPPSPSPRLGCVIVPLDGSPLAEQVLPHVVALAGALRLNIILVRVTPAAADYLSAAEYPFPHYGELLQGVDAKAMAYLGGVGARLRERGGLLVEERLLHGQPAAALVELAREMSENLVAMTTHGRSGIGRWLLGSVTDRVVRYSGDPVLVVRASASPASLGGRT